MKKTSYTISALIAVLLISVNVYAQVPQGFNFQAVARASNGELLLNTPLGVQIKILKGDETGTVVYSETHALTTSAAGLIQLVIGEGSPEEEGSFSAIDWSLDNYYVALAIDIEGGTEYESLGTTRLLSVPYALLAKKVVNGSGGENVTEFTFNKAEGDTSFIIKSVGDESLPPLVTKSATGGQNSGAEFYAESDETNTELQVGVYGDAAGTGSGTHMGVYGSAINFEASGGSRRGVYGQAASLAKYNYGTFGYAGGAGNGDEGVGIGVGSINFGSYGYATGNTWSNTGLEAYSAGDQGKVNYGVHGLSEAGASDSTKNYGVAGRAFGPGINYGVYGSSWDGIENWAGFFDGDVQINGNLTVNGTVNGSGSSSGEEVALPLDMAGPNGNRSVMLSSEGENGEDGSLRLANTDGFSRVTMYANGYYNDESEALIWSNAGGAWFGGANGTMNVQIGATGDYSNGLLKLGDTNGSDRINLSVNTDSAFYSYGKITLSDSDDNFGTFWSRSVIFDDPEGDRSSLGSSWLQFADVDESGTGTVYNWYSKGSMQVANSEYANGERSTGMNGGYFWMDINKNGNFYAPLTFGIGNEEEGGNSWFEMSTLSRAESEKGSLFSISTAPGGSGQEAAQAYFYGQSSVNIQMGGETWNNSDMAFLQMYGQTPTDDENWFQYNVRISVGTDGTHDAGYLSLNKTNIANKTSEETILLDGQSGDIWIAGTVTQASDLRLKTNVQTLDHALEKVTRLRGVSYNWKSDPERQTPQIGLIAQELEQVYPEFVHNNQDGMKSVNYAQLTAVLIEAIKELNAEIEQLKQENLELHVELNKATLMEERLQRIEQLLQSGAPVQNTIGER